MRRFFVYLGLELKRNIRMLPSFIGSILILIILVFSGLLVTSYFLEEKQLFSPIVVDCVMQDEEEKLKLAMMFVSNLESVKSICQFEYTTEEEARNNIKTGQADAAIILKDNFYEDMQQGKNTPAIILVPEHSALQLDTFRELVAAGVSLIQTTEAGVYAVFDAGKQYNLNISYEDVQQLIFFQYVEKILERNEVFQKKVLLATGEYDLVQYYFASGLLICILISGLNFGFLYRKTDDALEEMLHVYGIGRFKISMAKLLVMGIILWILTLFLTAVCSGICGIAGIDFLFMDEMTVLGQFLISLSVAALFHVIYCLGKEKGTVLIFFLDIGMILCSGVLIPSSYLPKPIQVISRINLLTYWDKHMMGTLFAQVKGYEFLLEIIIIGLGILLGSLRINRKWKN